MTEDYINGFLECVSRVKDILTPHVGGFNQFFSIDRNLNGDVLTNIKDFMTENKNYYKNSSDDNFFENTLNKISIIKIDNWEKNLQGLVQNWTCDKDLSGLHGKNGFLLSECLINSLLKEFFKKENVEVYKMLPDWGTWHWGDHMSEEYLFVTNRKIFILHLGESS
ncbi:hypothetical protein [Ohtaekwangia koreensis]|uniref:Uncharacterized protein n=1 Tax=Ohtaekwangia koreensis TaxID=688867 RepID=A0A1T5LSS6_9BACT|nr:hypothetical protein [Ohtaekwangia koreensis]SKC79022.1 hypothetical protein SAMN05660236_3857 [Ohtaekwangia koreensis]